MDLKVIGGKPAYRSPVTIKNGDIEEHKIDIDGERVLKEQKEGQ